jgi:hypothetical protein
MLSNINTTRHDESLLHPCPHGVINKQPASFWWLWHEIKNVLLTLAWSHSSRIPSWSVFECHYLYLVFIIVIHFSVHTAIVAGQQLLHLLEAKANACKVYDSVSEKISP